MGRRNRGLALLIGFRRGREGGACPPKLSPQRSVGGFSLLEVMVALSVLIIGLVGLLAVIASTTRLNALSRENLVARRSAERMLESMRNTPWKDIFKHYHLKANDAYTPAASVSAVAHGPDFEVEKNDAGLQVLRPLSGDADGKCGKIYFPTDASGSDLLEKGSGAFVGSGADLDLDRNGLIDTTDVSKDYKLLPVRLVIEWEGISGPRSLTYHHVFMER